MQKYLRDNALIAVPFDLGFCVMKKSTYAEKLEKVDCKQFRKLELR